MCPCNNCWVHNALCSWLRLVMLSTLCCFCGCLRHWFETMATKTQNKPLECMTTSPLQAIHCSLYIWNVINEVLRKEHYECYGLYVDYDLLHMQYFIWCNVKKCNYMLATTQTAPKCFIELKNLKQIKQVLRNGKLPCHIPVIIFIYNMCHISCSLSWNWMRPKTLLMVNVDVKCYTKVLPGLIQISCQGQNNQVARKVIIIQHTRVNIPFV